jgi:hypothetical protein
MKQVTIAVAALLAFASTLHATPQGWPNPLNADVYGLAGPDPQPFSILWSGSQYHLIAPGWDLTIVAGDDGFYPLSTLDPAAKMKIVDANAKTLATFDVTYDHQVITTHRTFTTDPSTNVVIKSHGLTPEPFALAPCALLGLALRRRQNPKPKPKASQRMAALATAPGVTATSLL